jgi:hypothetical protein
MCHGPSLTHGPMLATSGLSRRLTAQQDAGDMTQNDELDSALIYFGGVLALIVGVVILAGFLRRQDRARVDNLNQRLGLEPVNISNSPADASGAALGGPPLPQ